MIWHVPMKFIRCQWVTLSEKAAEVDEEDPERDMTMLEQLQQAIGLMSLEAARMGQWRIKKMDIMFVVVWQSFISSCCLAKLHKFMYINEWTYIYIYMVTSYK